MVDGSVSGGMAAAVSEIANGSETAHGSQTEAY